MLNKILIIISTLFMLTFCVQPVKEEPSPSEAKKVIEETQAAKDISATASDAKNTNEKGMSERFLVQAYAEEKSIKKIKDPKLISKAKAIFTEANTLYKIKKNKEALAKYEEGLEIAAEPEAYYRYGNVLSNLDRLEDSIKAYDISISLNYEKEYHAIYNKACAYSRLKKAEESYTNIFASIDKGYKAITYMAEDPDLEYLRSQADWKTKYKEIKKRAKEKEELDKNKG